jgi:hypothetical protein
MQPQLQTFPSSRTSPRLASRKSANSSPKEPPQNILASPNAFDWEKRLMMPGSSPAAFTFSLSPKSAGTQQLFEYPKDYHHQQQQQADLETIMLLNQASGNHADSILGMPDVYSSEVLSVASSTSSSFLNPLEARRTHKDRQDAHRESERRRRENMKSALSTLESLVNLALDSPNRKLSHSEIYTTAREMIVALKEQISAMEAANEALKSKH